jgi:hypothetical protein
VTQRLTEEERKWFDDVRLLRNKYLHYYSREYATIAADAVSIYHTTVRLLIRVLGLGIHDGVLTVRPEFLSYVQVHSNSGLDESAANDGGQDPAAG